MSRNRFTGRQWAMIAAPIVLVLSMWAAFQGFVAWLGSPPGYLAAFIVYWIGWCIVVPVVILGLRGVLDLFREGEVPFAQLGWKTQALLWWPIVFPLGFIFIPRVAEANAAIIAVSILLGVVIGVTEELLWRGVYVRLFPDDVWLNTVYPSVIFGLWHVAPQSVRTSTMPGGAASFVVYAVVLGLSYATYARKTGSIRWCTMSHCIHDALGLGAFVYSAWLT